MAVADTSEEVADKSKLELLELLEVSRGEEVEAERTV